jgi:hypothetical protein
MASTLHQAANCYFAEGKYGLAADLYKRAIAIYRIYKKSDDGALLKAQQHMEKANSLAQKK